MATIHPMEDDKNSIATSCTVSRARTNCFELLTPDESELVEKNQVIVTYKKGETIVKQGSFASHIMFISSGLAKIFMEKNNEVLILKIIPGEIDKFQ
ncbi:cyclic nucleotide-binding domain-containing protein [Bacteroidota bacterium]